MSEYGFQSFPELATRRALRAAGRVRIDSPVMLSHQRHPRGNPLVRTYMDRDFREPKDFASFLYVSQVLQATVIQYGAEAHRRRMPYNQGSLYWQLDDCWPVASWSGIDYFGRWKALHYAARRFFAPVLVSTVEEDGDVRVYGVSDRRTPTRGAADAAAGRLRRARAAGARRSDVTLAANASAVLSTWPRASALQGADPARVVLVAELAAPGGERIARSLFYFEKTQGPGAARARAGGRGDAARVGRGRLGAGRGAATGARSAAGGRPAPARSEEMFSDNYFDLLPGEAVTVEWNGAVPRVKATSIRDTY